MYAYIKLNVEGEGIISNQFKLGIKAENIINPLLNWNIDRGVGFPSSYTETYPLIIAGGLFYSINTIRNFGHNLNLLHSLS